MDGLPGAAFGGGRTPGASASGRAPARAAQGTRQQFGPAAAASALLGVGATSLELQDENDPAALRELLHDAADAGQIAQLEEPMRALLEAHPDLASAHEMMGLWLALGGAPAAQVRAACERALEIAPKNARCLEQLADSYRESEPERALELYERAAEADPEAFEPRFAKARLLRSSGHEPAAEHAFRALLRDHPYEGGPAAELAETQIAREAVGEETAALARRAARFGRSLQDFDRLARVYRELGKEDRARETEALAARLGQKRVAPSSSEKAAAASR